MTPTTNVLTLRLDPGSQQRFDLLRREHFPPERNHIPAHLTLFHTLPDLPEIRDAIQREADAQAPFRLAVTGLRSLGKGVAYKLRAEPLNALHARLKTDFSACLTPQDRQPLQPHIVIQNKATVAAARALLSQLEQTFAPGEIDAIGIDLWHYLGGPWELAETFPFRHAATPTG